MLSKKVNLLTTTSMTLFRPLSTIQQDVLDCLNEFIALQSVRDKYYKELTKPILLPLFSGDI